MPAAGWATVGIDEPVQVAVAGVSRRDGGEPVTADHHWHIGSCTKSLTAALVATFVDDGTAGWDLTIGEAFADLGSDVHDDWAGVRLDEVLLCRAGFAANLSQSAMQIAWRDERTLLDQRTNAVASALRAPPKDRGSFLYSNLSYVVAGAIVDRLAGVPYEVAMQARLFEPLGVTSAGYGPPPHIWGHPNRVRFGPLTVGRGSGADPAEVRSDNPSLLNPAGRLHLTLWDWATLQRLFLDGAGLLSQESLTRLLDAPPGLSTMAMGWVPAALPGASLGMQGSNTAWVATAMLAEDRRRAALVVCNDGRSRLFAATAVAAAGLVAPTR